MNHEGVIKFAIERFEKSPPLADPLWRELEHYRAPLWVAGLIGFDPASGYGFGNMSRRLPAPSGGRTAGPRFVITGSQTGHLEHLTGEHYCVVEEALFSKNRISCSGPVAPSSESLSHAAFYTRPEVQAVVHVHSRELWNRLKQEDCLSTPEDVAYGSPELYRFIIHLMNTERRALPLLLVTLGHQDGVFAAGTNVGEVCSLIAAVRTTKE